MIGLSPTLDVKMDPTLNTVKARKRKPAVSAPALLASPSSRSSIICLFNNCNLIYSSSNSASIFFCFFRLIRASGFSNK